jgi:hypothetical protein
MRANRLKASAGLRWVAEAFLIFRVAPLRQLFLGLAFLLAIGVALSLPVVGFAVTWLLIPALVVGPHALARAASRGTAPPPALLLEGFRGKFRSQLRLGGFYLAGMTVVLVASALGDGGQFARAMVGLARIDIETLQQPDTQTAVLIATALQTLLIAALWYAPLLVAWKDVTPLKAVFFSAAAALINWRAFAVYGVAITVLFTFVLFLALAGVMLLGGGRVLHANSAMFAVLWTLLPVGFASSFLSYRDVFDAEDVTREDPGKSPTIEP